MTAASEARVGFVASQQALEAFSILYLLMVLTQGDSVSFPCGHAGRAWGSVRHCLEPLSHLSQGTLS